MQAESCPGQQHSPQDAIAVVIAWGIFFLFAEHAMLYSKLPEWLTWLFTKNPRMSREEARQCVPMVVTRFIGFIHNTVQVPVAIWLVSHPALLADRLHATTDTSRMMLCVAGGFFLHDAVCCLLRESPFYVVHGLTCCLGYVAAAAYGSGHFYGGLFLLWEISTPFVQLRWILHKMALAESGVYVLNSFLMVVTFTLVRVVFGSYFTFLLFHDTVMELSRTDGGCVAPSALLIGLCTAAGVISTLNYYWCSLMFKSLLRIYARGQSWSQASLGKNE